MAKRTRTRVPQTRPDDCNRRQLATASLEEVQAALTLEQGRLATLEAGQEEATPSKRGAHVPVPSNLRYKRRLVGWLEEHAKSLGGDDAEAIQRTAQALRGNA